MRIAPTSPNTGASAVTLKKARPKESASRPACPCSPGKLPTTAMPVHTGRYSSALLSAVGTAIQAMSASSARRLGAPGSPSQAGSYHHERRDAGNIRSCCGG